MEKLQYISNQMHLKFLDLFFSKQFTAFFHFIELIFKISSIPWSSLYEAVRAKQNDNYVADAQNTITWNTSRDFLNKCIDSDIYELIASLLYHWFLKRKI